MDMTLGMMAGLATMADDLASLANGTLLNSLTQSEIDDLNRDLTAFFSSQGKGAVSEFADIADFGAAVLQRANLFDIDGEIYTIVDTVAEPGTDSADVLATLESLGLAQGSAFGNVVSGLLPIASIEMLDGVNGLASASAAALTTNVGSVTSQDDIALLADIAREDLGFDGTGVTVGILSDSFDASLTATTTYADDIASGDLPDDVLIIEDLPVGFSIDEGRGMAQLIADIAPGADLQFATAFTGAAGFANNILALAEAGSDVIVDDIIYFFEPMFQDGIIAQAAAQVVEQGVPYFSSAGNNGIAGYQAPFRATEDAFLSSVVPFGTGIDGTGTQFHDWDPGEGVDTTLDIVIPAAPGGVLITDWFLQWTDPFLSAFDPFGDTTGPAEFGAFGDTDLDIHLLDMDGNVLFSSIDANAGFGDPTERLFVDNFGSEPIQAQVAINKFTGPDPELMRIVGFGVPNDDFVTGYGLELNASFDDLSEFRAGTTYGHSVAEGAFGVGAAPFFYTEPFGAVEGTIPEAFTSLGEAMIFFDEFGNPLPEPIVRDAVDFTATDGGNTTFFINDLTLPPELIALFPGGDPDADAFPNFFGTSAAAPNAAAIAALMLQANPDLTPADIERLLEETALDITAPFASTDEDFEFSDLFQDIRSVGVTEGNDARTGAGLVQATEAVQEAFDETVETVDVNSWFNPDFGGGFIATFEITLTEGLIGGPKLEAFSFDIDIDEGTFVNGWVNGFNGPLSFDPDTGTFSNAGAGFQPTTEAGTTIAFNVQIDGTGFDIDNFDFNFTNLTPPAVLPEPSDDQSLEVASASLNDWGAGFVQNVRVTNTGDEMADGWIVKLELGDMTASALDSLDIFNAWSTQDVEFDGDVFFFPETYNSDIGVGQSVEFGFQASVEGNSGVPYDPDTAFEIVSLEELPEGLMVPESFHFA
ncbi:MAG: cellulose binding domain-containing protein [Alphaproteobacteria bacterium]